MKQMSRRERVLAAINRQPVDRVPYAVWRHFPSVDRSPAGLAQATLRFHERYGSDFLKITPRGGYAVEAWGCVEGDAVREDGHRPCASCAVRAHDDWKKIRALDPGAAPGYTEEIETIIRLGIAPARRDLQEVRAVSLVEAQRRLRQARWRAIHAREVTQ